MNNMKKSIKILIAFSALVLFSNCSSEEKQTETQTEEVTVVQSENEEGTMVTTKTVDMDPIAFMEKLKELDGVLIDVRTPGEFEAGAIEGATNIDFNGGNFESEIESLDKEKPTFVYCMHGGRSSAAMQTMHDKGFKEVYNLIGGYSAYSEMNP